MFDSWWHHKKAVTEMKGTEKVITIQSTLQSN